MNPADLPGFDPRVRNQLAQLSLDQQSTTSSQSSYRSANDSVSSHNHNHHTYNTYIHPQRMHHQQRRSVQTGHAAMSPEYQSPMLGPDAFPPLGSTRPAPSAKMTRGQTNYSQGPGHVILPSQNTPDASHAAQRFFSQTRGRGRGRGHRQLSGDSHNFNQPPPPQNPRWSDQRQSFDNQTQYRPNRHRAIDQADYMDYLAQNSMTNMLTRDELHTKHQFRRRLEELTKSVWESLRLPDGIADPLNVRLQSYGSLSNSFGTSGCDVDLLLTVEKAPGDYVEIGEKYKRELEKALLEQGIGARLLTNTRIPIIRVCEKPSDELLENLWQNHKNREIEERIKPPATKASDAEAAQLNSTETPSQDPSAALAALDLNAEDAPVSKTTAIDHNKLEFGNDCGIQCDINFTNQVALHNTKMLWTYGQCDARVRHLGIFVKNWAKARAINNPYHGTLSSYGYVLMALHYLMNVANPPVIPNLQDMGHQALWGRPPTDICGGHDVTFSHNLDQIREHMSRQPRNQSSLGALLFGFFRYYGNAREGFDWKQDTVSIRNPGGILSKQDKGWTEAKWTGDGRNVRLRYLLAIEDPFEVDHNIARTVGHNGIIAIRDEFRRSWNMLLRIQRVQGPSSSPWVWSPQDPAESGDGLDFIRATADRGDLLKKDNDYRREKMRLLKQKKEEEEELAKSQALQGIVTDEDHTDTFGMSAGKGEILSDTDSEDQGKLIHNVQLQDFKVTRMRGPQRVRRVLTHDDDESDNEDFRSTKQLSGDADLEAAYSEQHHGNSENGSEEWVTAYEPSSPQAEMSWHTNDEGNNPTLWDVWVHDEPISVQSSIGARPQPDQTILDRLIDARSIDTDNYQQKEMQNTKDNDVPKPSPDQAAQFHAVAASRLASWNNDLPNEATPSDPQMPEPLSARTKRLHRVSQPPPQPSASIPQAPDYLPPQRPSPNERYPKAERSDAVGDFIPWSRETQGGRWLLRRDQAIRDGKCIELTSGDTGRLNAKFPYDPNMTSDELAEKNRQLEKHYYNSLYSRQSPEMQARVSDADRTADEIQSVLKRDSSTGSETRLPKADLERIIDAGLIGDSIYWSPLSDTGRWLRWRDRKILAGLWKPQPHDSLAALVSDLFPRSPTTTVGDMTRMNDELDEFFVDFEYPRPGDCSREEFNERARAIKYAVKRTQRHRASRETKGLQAFGKGPVYQEPSFLPQPAMVERSMPISWQPIYETKLDLWDASKIETLPVEEIVTTEQKTEKMPAEVFVIEETPHKADEHSQKLLDMFKRDDKPVTKTVHHILDPEDQNTINQRSMQAIQNLSAQLSKSGPTDREALRAQRLAYYEKSKPEVPALAVVDATPMSDEKISPTAVSVKINEQEDDSESEDTANFRRKQVESIQW